MTTPTTSPDPSDDKLDRIDHIVAKVEKIETDVAQLLEVFLKLWEQFNILKDSPMLSAFFPAPRKK